MSDQFNRGGKNDGNRKYTSLNLSQHFNKSGPKSAAKATTGRGLQSLGKVGVSTRRLPRPAVCSSLKKQNAGNDPNVALVPGGGGWGSKKDTSSSEVQDGEKGGWKEVAEPAPTVQNHAFQQEFPSLGDEHPAQQRLELRPQTVRWGEKQSARQELDSAPQLPTMGGAPAVTPAFGMPGVVPIYGVMPVAAPVGAVFPGVTGPVYRYPAQPIYGPNGAPANPPPMIPYMYSAPPPLHPVPAKEEPREKPDTTAASNGPDHWGDDEGTSQSVTPDTTSSVGYVSPYTQPFPGKVKQPEEPRPEPAGKEEKRPERITYHGRTSSHSSLSEPPEEETSLAPEDASKPDPSAPRVLSRSIPKRQLKAFPPEEEAESKKGEGEEVSTSWEEEEVEKGVSVWEERQRAAQDGPWAPLPEQSPSSDRFFDEDYDPVVRDEPAPARTRAEQPLMRSGEFRAHKDRRLMDDGQRKALRDATEYISNLSLQSGEPKKITIAQKPKILQKPAVVADVSPTAPLPPPSKPVRSAGAPTSNYWQEKQAERERVEAEEERKRREEQKAEAMKARQQQYQDYRAPGEYSSSRRAGRYPSTTTTTDDQDRDARPDRNGAVPRGRRHREGEFRIAYRGERKRPAPRPEEEEELREYQPREPREEYREPPREPREAYEPRGESRDGSRDPAKSRDRYREPRRRQPSRESRPEDQVGGRRDESRGSRDESRGSRGRYNFYEDPDRFYYERPSLRAKRSTDRPVRQRQQRPEREQPEGESGEAPADDTTTTTTTSPTISPHEDQPLPPEQIGGGGADEEERRRERRNPNEKYEQEMYERPEFTTYRRVPRSGDRNSRRRPRHNDQPPEEGGEEKAGSRRRARVEKYKSGEVKENRRAKSERAPRKSRDGEEGSSDEPRSKSHTTRRGKEGGEEGGTAERPPRKTKKAPSIVYYSANPADRAKTAGSQPSRAPRTDKPKTERREKSADTAKGKEAKSKKDAPGKKEGEAKAAAAAAEASKKEAEAKKNEKIKNLAAKNLEKTLEMDRLKKMTQAGVDLLSIGIYAVDGKELDRDSVDHSEGFVEVVRKKSKKDPEQPEKKPSAAASASSTGNSGKSKKSKKASSSKQKKLPISQEEAKQQAQPPASTTPPIEKPAVKSWTNTTPTAVDLNLSAIWSNNPPPPPAGKKNAWDKPLTFADKQSLDTREMLPPISGESTSLFSSEADQKESVWRGDGRPPRFTREKAKGRTEVKKEGEVEMIPSDPGSPLDIIPPGVEDLFGLKSDGEDEKPTLKSLVLDPQIPAVTPVVVGSLSQRNGELPSSEEIPEIAKREVSVSPGQVSAETSTQTTPPAARSLEEGVVAAPPSLNPVKQLITSTSVLSLTDQLREIGGQPETTSQFFMQGSPLMHSLQNSPGLRSEAPLLTHFISQPAPGGPVPDVTPHHHHHVMPSPHQLGSVSGMSSNPAAGVAPLMGSHLTSTLSSLGRPTNELFKSYSPNKIYPASNVPAGAQSLISQNLFNQFTTPHSYASPSMSPIPSQMNPFASFQKPASPKLGGLYNSPQGSFDALDPTGGMMSFTQTIQKAPQSALTSQQLFYQRMVAPHEMYYKMKPQDNILLQSDLSKHLDAKPFNPGTVNPMGQPIRAHMAQMAGPRPPTAMFKPELLQQVMMQQNGGPMAMPATAYKGYDKEPIGTRPHIIHRPSDLPSASTGLMGQHHHHHQHQQQQQQQFRLPNVMFPGHGVTQPAPPPPPQQQQQQQQPAPPPQAPTRQDMFIHPKAPVQHLQQMGGGGSGGNSGGGGGGGGGGRPPRVKLARDGRLHRMPEVRGSKFGSFLPPSVQQHMQQQSLAQIQQYSSAISRGEKETLPESMKPSPTKVSPPVSTEKTTTDSSPVEKVIVEEEPRKITEEEVVKEQEKEEERVEEVVVVKEEKKEGGGGGGGEEKQKAAAAAAAADKRKFESRNTYRRRNYGYHPPDQYYSGPPPPAGPGGEPPHYYERPPYRPEERYYEERRGGYRGGRGFPPPPIYRGYPPLPPRDYGRRGGGGGGGMHRY